MGHPQAADSWRRILVAMMAVQFTMMMAFTSSMPLVALYIGELGVTDPFWQNIWAGVVGCSNFLIAAIVSPYWGALADRTGRKLMVLRSTFAIALFTALLGLVQNVWQLLAVRFLQGAVTGYNASANALVATTVPEGKLGYAFGWMQSAGLVGTLIGPLAGGLLADVTGSYRTAFYLTSSFAFAAFLITLFLVREPKVQKPATGVRKPSMIEQFKSVLALKQLRAMFLVLFLAQFTVMSVNPVLSLFIEELLTAEGQLVTYLGTIAGLAVAVTGVADLIASPFLGKRSDQLGYRRVLTICLAGAGLMYLPQMLAPNVWVYVAARFGLGLFIGGILPTANALIGNLAPKEQRGQIFGFTASAQLMGSFLGPLLGGLGAALFGIRAMLGVTALLYLVNLIWVRKQVQDPS